MVKKAIAAALTAVMFTTSAYAACDISVKNSQITLNLSDFKGYNEVMIRVFREGFDGNDIDSAKKMSDVVAYQTQLTTDSRGKTEVSFYLDKSGNYTIEIGEAGSEKTEKYELKNYADISYNDDVIKNVNEAISKKDSTSLKSLVEVNYAKLNLDAKLYYSLDEEAKKTAYSLIANGKKIETVAELEKQLDTAAFIINTDTLAEGEAKEYFEKNISDTSFAQSGMYKIYNSYMSDAAKRTAISAIQKATYISCEDALEKYTEAVVTIAIQEALGAQTVKDVLYACSDEIEIDTVKCDKLKNPMNVYQALAGTKFNDIEEIEKAFEDAYNVQYKKENSNNSFSGGGGGGGGGGVSAPTVIVRDPDTINVESSAANESVKDIEEEEVFTDLVGYEWAKNDILSLYKSGVISGKGDRSFAPADNVKREEFVKLLTLALNIYDENAECEFADVPYDAWYYTYVASAVNIGMVNGIDKSHFGTGSYITRQDVAVMISRAMENVSAGEAASVYIADKNEISEYAMESVTAMYEKKILYGNECGAFMPKNNTTRAEAAVIIGRMLRSI